MLSAGEPLPASPVGDLSALLLLLLLNAPHQAPLAYNPFKRALTELRDAQAGSREERITATVTLALATLDGAV